MKTNKQRQQQQQQKTCSAVSAVLVFEGGCSFSSRVATSAEGKQKYAQRSEGELSHSSVGFSRPHALGKSERWMTLPASSNLTPTDPLPSVLPTDKFLLALRDTVERLFISPNCSLDSVCHRSVLWVCGFRLHSLLFNRGLT